MTTGVLLRWSISLCISVVLVACSGSTQPEPVPTFALQFDGIDDYVQVPDRATLDFGTGDFTWEMWLKRGRTGIREDMLTKKDVLKESEHDLALLVDRTTASTHFSAIIRTPARRSLSPLRAVSGRSGRTSP
jgi:hypothetical protein